MRVLCLTTSYPRFVGDPGGHFVEAHVRQLQREGGRLDVVAPGRAPGVEERDGATIHWLGGATAFGTPGVMERLRTQPIACASDVTATAFRFGRTWEKLLNVGGDRRPDRIVAHWLVPSLWPTVPRLKFDGPVDAYAHGGDIRLLRRMPSVFRQRILASLADHATTMTFASHSLAAALLAATERRAVAQRIERIATVAAPPFDVPHELRDPGRRASLRRSRRRSLGVSEDATVAVAISRLVASKRVDLAVDAVERLESTHLVVVGDGPMLPGLQSRARRLDARAHFTGFLPRDQALATLAAADVLLHPSAVEAAPTVVREARALGIPVIACEAGDVPRWSAADPEIRCVPHDAKAIADELRRFERPRSARA